MPLFDPAVHIQIAADSRDTLRKCDVFRVIDSCPNGIAACCMAKHILAGRPDLADEVGDCLHECGATSRRLSAEELVAYPVYGPRSTPLF